MPEQRHPGMESGDERAEEAYEALRSGDLDRAEDQTRAYLEDHPEDPGALAFLELVEDVRVGDAPARWEDAVEQREDELAFRCIVCGCEDYTSRTVLLDTRIMTFFDLEWLNRGARGFVCDRCGFVHTFVERRESPWKAEGVAWPDPVSEGSKPGPADGVRTPSG